MKIIFLFLMCDHFRPVHLVHLWNCKGQCVIFAIAWALLCFFSYKRELTSHSKTENTVRSSAGRLKKEMGLGCCAVTKCCKLLLFLRLAVNKAWMTFSPRQDEWLHPIFAPLYGGYGISCENHAPCQVNPFPLNCSLLSSLSQPSCRSTFSCFCSMFHYFFLSAAFICNIILLDVS